MEHTNISNIAKFLMKTPIAIRYFSQQELIDVLNIVGFSLSEISSLDSNGVLSFYWESQLHKSFTLEGLSSNFTRESGFDLEDKTFYEAERGCDFHLYQYDKTSYYKNYSYTILNYSEFIEKCEFYKTLEEIENELDNGPINRI